MNWLISGCLFAVYAAILAALPIKHWTYRQADWTGLLLMLPFLGLQHWLTGGSSFWAFYPIQLGWRVIRLRGLPQEKGTDWLGSAEIVVLIAVVVVIFLSQKYGLTLPGVPRP